MFMLPHKLMLRLFCVPVPPRHELSRLLQCPRTETRRPIRRLYREMVGRDQNEPSSAFVTLSTPTLPVAPHRSNRSHVLSEPRRNICPLLIQHALPSMHAGRPSPSSRNNQSNNRVTNQEGQSAKYFPSASRTHRHRKKKVRGPNPQCTPERLQKVLARAGVSSRRGADALIAAGRVSVNGVVAKVGVAVLADQDTLCVDNVPVVLGQAPRREWLAVHKPPGVLCSVESSAASGRRTIDALVRDAANRGLTPIGRIGFADSGLVLLTNERRFAHALSQHCHLVREFQLLVAGHVTEADLKKLRKFHPFPRSSGTGSDPFPIDIDVIECAWDATVPGASVTKPGKATWVNIRVRELREKQFVRMFDAEGYKVVRVKCVAFGPVRLGPTLRKGMFKTLTPNEVKALKRSTYGSPDLASCQEAKSGLP